jgi:hypothetical protein
MGYKNTPLLVLTIQAESVIIKQMLELLTLYLLFMAVAMGFILRHPAIVVRSEA